MMHMGEMTKSFVGIGKEAQADIKPEDAKHATNIANLLGIDCEWMINYFCSKITNIFNIIFKIFSLDNQHTTNSLPSLQSPS